MHEDQALLRHAKDAEHIAGPAKPSHAAILRGLEMGIYALAVGGAFVSFTRQGAAFSAQFDRLGSRPGQLPGLRTGWLFGRSMDLSDIQWRQFREGLPMATAGMAAYAAASQLVVRLKPAWQRLFNIAFSSVYLGVLHGAAVAFPLLLGGTSFAVSHATAGSSAGPACIWATACGSLLAARIFDGGSFAAISVHLAPLDAYRGVVRWHIVFNLLLLRLISFGMDLHWARLSAKRPDAAPAPYGTLPEEDGPPGQYAPGAAARDTLKARATLPHPPAAYSAAAFLEYAFYPPLYLAGPTITFNCFCSQRRSPRTIGAAQVAVYAARWLLALLLLEALTHTLYFNAVARFGLPAWRAAAAAEPAAAAAAPAVTPVLAALTGWWVLTFMWLKFTVMWRFFRLAALAAGMDAPENIRRCFANNYDIEGFWKNWHASYNLWLVRYLYVPLGGARRRALAVWPVFTFVAAWHDLEWRLLAWAWLSCLLFAPELAAKWLARQGAVGRVRGGAGWRPLCAAGAALNIAGLMAANLAGFVVGPAGLPPLLAELAAQPGFVAASLGVFFAAAQLMFWLRERETAVGRRVCPVDVLQKDR